MLATAGRRYTGLNKKIYRENREKKGEQGRGLHELKCITVDQKILTKLCFHERLKFILLLRLLNDLHFGPLFFNYFSQLVILILIP